MQRHDLVDLELFIHVVDAGSLTAGAQRSHLALASASARVRGMERALGLALLERGRRGVTPTPAGEALLRHARLVLHQVDLMRDELGQFARGLRGHIRLLCNSAALSEFLPLALGGFMRRHPQVDVELEERLSDDIVKAIGAGQAEIGIVSDAANLAGLQTFPFRADRLVAVLAANAPPLAVDATGAVAFAALLERDFVGLPATSALQRYLEQHAAAHAGGRRQPWKVRVRLPGFDAVCRTVEGGAGIGVVPQAAALRCARSMALSIVPLSDPWALRQLTICVRQYKQLPLYTKQLIDELQSGARQHHEIF